MLRRPVTMALVLVALLVSCNCVVAEVVLDQSQQDMNMARRPPDADPPYTVWMGQTFTAQVDGTLSCIELNCRSFTTRAKAVLVTATVWDDARGAYIPDVGQVLAATTVGELASYEWHAFDFLSAGAEIQAGQTYAVVVQAQSDAGDFQWQGWLGDVYAGGTACGASGEVPYWSLLAQDMAFRTWVQVSAGEQLFDLGDYIVAATVDVGLIDPELGGALLAKVDAALAALQRGNPNDAKVAMNDLKALVNQVEAQSGNKIDPATADETIARANEIIAALEAAM